MLLWILMSPGLLTASCDDQYQNHLNTDMALSYEQFDQTMDAGFRPLAQQCKAPAIDLIKNYIVLNQAEQDSLRWHIAQLSGEVGRINEAILYAKSTYRQTETGDFKWNDYVSGYIAYWQQDISLLKEKIKVLETHTSHQGNAMNAKLLSRFLVELQNQ
ncbi:MAG: hypothetical protein DHS20C09_18070 [marine bacterium B5-7]|nr:MAG: hypothetical protein DHS20C09_18070 [marine bacterium B5-7]